MAKVSKPDDKLIKQLLKSVKATKKKEDPESAAKTKKKLIKLYRGIGADTQEELDKYIAEFTGGGKAGTHGGKDVQVHGDGDYFTPNKETAAWYAQGGATKADAFGEIAKPFKYTHVFEYEVPEDDFINEQGIYKEAKEKAKAAAYEAVAPKIEAMKQALGPAFNDHLANSLAMTEYGPLETEEFKKAKKKIEQLSKNALGKWVDDGSDTIYIVSDREGFLKAAKPKVFDWVKPQAPKKPQDKPEEKGGNSEQYWKDRALQMKASTLRTAQGFNRAARNDLKGAAKEIEKAMAEFYDRYTKTENPELSLTDVKKQLRGSDKKNWQHTLDEWQELSKQAAGGDDEAEKAVQQEYLTSRVSRMKALEAQMKVIMSKYADETEAGLGKTLKDTFKDTYYRTTYNIQGQKHAFSSNFAKIDEDTLDAALTEDWHGSNFSKKVWDNYTDTLPSMLRESITRGVALGYGPDMLTKQIRTQFNNFSQYNVHRLINTELAHVVETATLNAYTENNINEYEYMATLESHTCALCGNLDGQVFRTQDAQEGLNYPVMHPHCRCDTAPYVDWDWGEDDPGVWMRDPETGKGRTITSTDFNTWKRAVAEDMYKDGADLLGDQLKTLAKKAKAEAEKAREAVKEADDKRKAEEAARKAEEEAKRKAEEAKRARGEYQAYVEVKIANNDFDFEDPQTWANNKGYLPDEELTGKMAADLAAKKRASLTSIEEPKQGMLVYFNPNFDEQLLEDAERAIKNGRAKEMADLLGMDPDLMAEDYVKVAREFSGHLKQYPADKKVLKSFYDMNWTTLGEIKKFAVQQAENSVQQQLDTLAKKKETELEVDAYGQINDEFNKEWDKALTTKSQMTHGANLIDISVDGSGEITVTQTDKKTGTVKKSFTAQTMDEMPDDIKDNVGINMAIDKYNREAAAKAATAKDIDVTLKGTAEDEVEAEITPVISGLKPVKRKRKVKVERTDTMTITRESIADAAKEIQKAQSFIDKLDAKAAAKAKTKAPDDGRVPDEFHIGYRTASVEEKDRKAGKAFDEAKSAVHKYLTGALPKLTAKEKDALWSWSEGSLAYSETMRGMTYTGRKRLTRDIKGDIAEIKKAIKKTELDQPIEVVRKSEYTATQLLLGGDFKDESFTSTTIDPGFDAKDKLSGIGADLRTKVIVEVPKGKGYGVYLAADGKDQIAEHKDQYEWLMSQDVTYRLNEIAYKRRGDKDVTVVSAEDASDTLKQELANNPGMIVALRAKALNKADLKADNDRRAKEAAKKAAADPSGGVALLKAAEKTIKKRQKENDDALKKAYNSVQLQTVEKTRQAIADSTKKAALMMNVKGGTIDDILRGNSAAGIEPGEFISGVTAYRTGITTKSSVGGSSFYVQNRENLEKASFDTQVTTTKKKAAANRHNVAKFGWLQPEGEDHWHDNFYGDITLQFKEEVRARTTYTLGDSLNHQQAAVPLGEKPNMIKYNSKRVDIDGNVKNVKDAWDFKKKAGSWQVEYIEAQYHGKLTLNDVDAMYLPASAGQATLRSWEKKLAPYGIKVYIYSK
jgi:SPP1 gp7 family putative phage head morphogenesis protein